MCSKVCSEVHPNMISKVHCNEYGYVAVRLQLVYTVIQQSNNSNINPLYNGTRKPANEQKKMCPSFDLIYSRLIPVMNAQVTVCSGKVRSYTEKIAEVVDNFVL